MGSENIFNDIYFQHYFYLKTGVKSLRFFCVLPSTRNLQCPDHVYLLESSKKFVQKYHPKISLQRRWKGLMPRKYLMKSQNYIKIAIRRSKTLAQLWISFKIVVRNILLNPIKLNLDFSDQYHIKLWTQNVLLLLSYWKKSFQIHNGCFWGFLCKKYLRQTSILGVNE